MILIIQQTSPCKYKIRLKKRVKMITIKKVEELKQYAKVIPASENDGSHNKVVFEFMENGEQADVLFDCAVDLNYECQKSIQNGYENCIYVKAKKITLNKMFTCDKIFVDDLVINDWCVCKSILAHKSISGNVLKCEHITCLSSIDCREIYTQKINSKKVKAQLLDIDNKIKLINLSCEKVEFN